MNIERIDAALAGTLFRGRLHHFAAIDSTNTRALGDAQAGAEAGQVYIADEQTAGRGRGGHTWHSEPDRGLYLTVLVKPALRSNDVLRLSMLTALAAAGAIEEVTLRRFIDLRWPNDLVIGERPARKVGGILTEAVSTPSGELRHAAIGIGINLNQVAFPADLAATATSLRQHTGSAVSREKIAIAFLQRMDQELHRLDVEGPSLQPGESLFDRFAGNSSWVRGKDVHVLEDGGYTGVTAGLTGEGLLRVRCEDGRERIVRHGGVRER